MARTGYLPLVMHDPPTDSPATTSLEMASSGAGSRIQSRRQEDQEADSRIQSRRQEGQDESELDIVQFFNTHFFVNEDDGYAVATVMRIGALKEPCTIGYRTEDSAALAGRNYVQTEGRIAFEAREELKQITVEIHQNPYFDSNLDFRLMLENPEGCIQSNVLQHCRIMIKDDDHFPSNDFTRHIKEDTLHEVGLRLLVSFILFCIRRIPLVGWRAYWTFFLDQFHNANYLWTIWLNVYLVDVVFNKDPEAEEHLWVHGPNGRMWTVALCALGQIVPKFLLTLIDYLQVGELAVAGKVKLHLKVNLFRRYLYYEAQSHHVVSAQDMFSTISKDVDEVVAEGFMVIFKMAQQIVQVGVILYFLIKSKPIRAAFLIVYPIIMATALNMRYFQSLKLQEAFRLADHQVHSCLRYSFDDLPLIKEYNKRGRAVTEFEGSLKSAGPPARQFAEFDFKTMLVSPWITNVAISLFVLIGGYYVINDDLSLGDFLASIGIYKDAGGIFSGFYLHMKNIYTVIGPFLRVVSLMNKATDTEITQRQAEARAQGVMDQFSEMDERGQVASYTKTNRFDMLQIRLVDVSLHHKILQNVSVSLPQGKLVALLGTHHTGKFSLLRILKGSQVAQRGQVQVPSHLSIICVPRVPQLLHRHTLTQNLVYGSDGEIDKDLLVKLCKVVKLHSRSIQMVEADLSDHFGDKAAEQSPKQMNMFTDQEHTPWHDQWSQSDLQKMHIVRALYRHPDVLLMQRPADEMEADHAAHFLDLLRSYVDNRGFGSATPEAQRMARPRTVFFTTGQDRERAEFAQDVADIVWLLSTENGFTQMDGGAAKHLKVPSSGDNKVVHSWSRQAMDLKTQTQSLQRDLETERQAIAEHKEKVELYSNRALVAQEESDQAQEVLFQVQNELQSLEALEYEEDEAGGFFGCVDRRASKQRLHNLNMMLADRTALSPAQLPPLSTGVRELD